MLGIHSVITNNVDFNIVIRQAGLPVDTTTGSDVLYRHLQNKIRQIATHQTTVYQYWV